MSGIRALFDMADNYGITLSIVGQTDGYVIRLDLMSSHARIVIENDKIYSFVINSEIMDDVIKFTHFYQDVLFGMTTNPPIVAI